MGSDEEQAVIDAAIATFPATFGLRAFPGTFAISRSDSFLSDAYDYKADRSRPLAERTVNLYVYNVESGEALTRGTPAEIRRAMVTR